VAQQPVELILIRHLASRLEIPVFVVNDTGDLVYFNEPAERVLGRRFDEIRSMPFEDWTTAFLPSEDGRALAVDELPLVQALRQRIPSHSKFDIVAIDGVKRTIEVTAYPVLTLGDRMVGAVAMFWESQAE
jgi:PAS domain-containing protein